MAVVYLYIPAQKLGDVIDCGLKLSEWKDRKQATPWSREARFCIRAFLHHLDYPGKDVKAIGALDPLIASVPGTTFTKESSFDVLDD